MEEQGKVCSKCGVWKPLEEYNKDKIKKDGRKSECKECQKERNKRWRENNKEYAKQYYQNNKECIKEYSKQYRENNKEYYKEYYKEYNKQWYQNNKEHKKEYLKQWRENNPDYNKQWRENNKEYKEYTKEYNKQWRENNKKYIKEYNKEYRESNKEYYKQWRENNKEYIKEINKQWRENNKEHLKEYFENNKERYHECDKKSREKRKENNLQYISSIVEQVNPVFKQLNLAVYGYIYKFENVKTSHVYIGQTIQPLKRRYGLEGGVIKSWIEERKERTNQKFKEELIEEDFVVTEILDIAFCQYHLDKLEAYYINKYDSYNNGYNNQAGNHNTDDGVEEFNQILAHNNLKFIDGKLVKTA